MPLDQADYQIETKPDLAKPSLEGLSYVLQHGIPKSHRWNFRFGLHRNECGTAGCAIGVGRVVWPEIEAIAQLDVIHFGTIEFGRIFGLTQEESFFLFSASDFHTSKTYGKPGSLVQPADVADAIDRYLASRS